MIFNALRQRAAAFHCDLDRRRIGRDAAVPDTHLYVREPKIRLKIKTLAQ